LPWCQKQTTVVFAEILIIYSFLSEIFVVFLLKLTVTN
jgi:hypothetical protein